MNTEVAPTVPAISRDPEAVELGHRIEAARGAVSRKTLGVFLGVHENTLGKWERGETCPTAIQLVHIAKLTKKNVEELLGLTITRPLPRPDEPQPVSNEAISDGETLHVPLFDVRAAAGHGSFDAIERVIEMRCFKEAFVRHDLGIKHNQLALVTVVGSSAEPTVHAGDVVLVDRRDTDVTVEGMHLVRVDHALMIKLLQRRPGCVVVSSRNEAYGAFEVQLNGGTDFEVLGRCRWAGVKLG